ncbi:hypothetical protein DFH07DRAFT_823430 [Mycena maculata]|uniref:DUF7704 domain-containing protein n=1 Tax=Mycena maculata TaxID=230809 RepID=A0AAD7J212_9AGAR|nr:hypothetical protein DFH07DRAFT_823430 [Mycena maculata]
MHRVPLSSPSDLVSRFQRSRSLSGPAHSGSDNSSAKMRPTSAIPTPYFAIFAVYEPFLTTMGFLGTLLDPKGTYDYQAPWPNGTPPEEFPLATRLTIVQLGHVCALLGLLNVWLLTTVRTHLSSQPALQEKIVSALLTPLLIGDFLHLYVTLYALGDQRWNFESWSPMLFVTIGLGFTLLVPRVMWQLGIGRYVDRRDGHYSKS